MGLVSSIITAVAQVRSLAWELSHAAGMAKKKKKKKKKKSIQFIVLVCFLSVLVRFEGQPCCRGTQLGQVHARMPGVVCNQGGGADLVLLGSWREGLVCRGNR